MIKINKIIGRQIIDSRGNPTCEADVILNNGIIGRGAVPSGASTGKLEALELRDNEAENFLGKSVNKAVFNINNENELPICAEVNIEPKNEISLRFHQKMGFKETSKRTINSNYKVKYVEKNVR